MVTAVEELLALCRTNDEATRLFNLNEQNIRVVRDAVKAGGPATIGRKRHLEAILGQMCWLRSQIRKTLRTGRGLRDRPGRNAVEWQEVKTRR